MTSRDRRRRAVAAMFVATVLPLLGPAAASASPGVRLPTPTAIFGLDVASLVQGIIEKLVSLILPTDLAGRWAVGLVRWLVVVPDVADPTRFPHLNAFRSGLVGLGFGLLAVSITVCGLQVALGAPILAPAARRTVVAAVVLVIYPKLISTAILGVNVATGQMITSRLVADGTDKMLGAALIVGVATGGFGWSLVLGAALFCLYFMAALMVMKIGVTAVLAVLLLAGALVWGLYPNPGTAWLARAWTSACVTIALILIGWALVFSAGALLSSDSLVWAGSTGSLGDQLEKVTKPFAAVACFWVAYRTPAFVLAAARTVGVHPGSMMSGARSSGRSAPRSLASAVQTNRDRFHAIGTRVATKAAPLGGALRSRALALRAAATPTSPRAAVTAAALAAGPAGSASGRVFDRAVAPVVGPAATALGAVGPIVASAGSAGARVARGAKTAAALPIVANRGWRELAAEGAELRRQAHSASPPAAASDGRGRGRVDRRPDRLAVSSAASTDHASTATGPALSPPPPPALAPQPVPTAPEPLRPDRPGRMPLPVASERAPVRIGPTLRVGGSSPQAALPGSRPPLSQQPSPASSSSPEAPSPVRRISSLGASARVPPTRQKGATVRLDALPEVDSRRSPSATPVSLTAPAQDIKPAAAPRRRPS
jgi:hypothetical protein